MGLSGSKLLKLCALATWREKSGFREEVSRAKAQRRQVRLEKKVYFARLRLGRNSFYFLSPWERTEVRAAEVDAPSPFPLPEGEGKERAQSH